ncbi:DUF3667 domain-containing protein [Pseudomarimonas salicorniae]|uniref:DUF3667 domain-containing protein n=1 Tax=Pseudomarimonas salicorniae TaxID=2933270 RepID=A0ABT0GLA2_9GAMM|nr:DUF3667 domain-containing protein [Lysobacter sp. CAU 1642]MCK7595313.1 DUF3667 domain-containing protein [Lysobacter sp. CAU 1642]
MAGDSSSAKAVDEGSLAAMPVGVSRLSLRDAWSELLDEWVRPDRGLPRTMWRLTVSPQRGLADWIERRDPRVTRPFRYLLVAAAVAALVWMGDGRVIDWDVWLTELGAKLEARNAGSKGQFGFVVGYLLATLSRSQPEVLLLLGAPLLALAIWAGSLRRLNAAEAWAVSLYASAQALWLVTVVGWMLPQSMPGGMGLKWGVALLAWAWTVSGSARGGVLYRLAVPSLALFAALWLVGAMVVVPAVVVWLSS